MRGRVFSVAGPRAFALALAVAALAVTTGCMSPPARYESRAPHDCAAEQLYAEETQFVMGRRFWLVDALGHYVISLPNKLILWNWRLEDHKIDPEVARELEEYFQFNHIHTTKVRINQWDPLGEFNRLCYHGRTHWLLRATFGALAWVEYTIIPGRLVGGDNYNPFTDTLSLYSSDPYVALHEAGHAKDHLDSNWPNLYTLARLIPGVDLWQEAVATRDAIGWCWEHGGPDRVARAHRTLYPAFGTYVGGFYQSFVPPEVVFPYAVGGAILGHGVAAYTSRNLEERRPR